MALPDIDFSAIRMHRMSQANAFEELCCQLAGDEQLPTTRVSFNRKGPGGDGGVECFSVLSDGTETCWQVKYYWEMANAVRSLDESLTQALAKHPKMTRFIACLPIDLADSRKGEVTTALMRWDEWKNDRMAKATALGRDLRIDRWDAYELKLRLTSSHPNAAGRIAFWFNQSLLTSEWFRKNFDRTHAELGERYSPKNHIDLPIRRMIEATALDPRLPLFLAEASQKLSEKLAATNRANEAAAIACDSAIMALTLASERPCALIPVAALSNALETARTAVLPWYKEQRDASTSNRPNPVATTTSNLLSLLSALIRELAQQYWPLIKTRALLVVGEAGSGKSHLLADVCDHAIREDRPAIMVLGGKLPDAEPWDEILKNLGLPRDLLVETFLGALNAAGQAAGVRTLLIIDALNERNGQAIWPERLSGLMHDVGRFEWVSLILSCRTTYEQLVIPEELDQSKLPRVEHTGFSEQEARRYLKKRGIRLAEDPNRIEEFETPLFLRICCDALMLEEREVLTSRLGGVTAIFKLYNDAVVKRVNKQLGVAPQRRLVERAIERLAQEMADTGREEIVDSRAYELIDTIFPPAIMQAGHDLLFQLQNEGMLSSQGPTIEGIEAEYRFTFQRMSDHAITNSLLDRSVNNGNVAAAFSSDTPLRRAITAPHSSIQYGLLEALAVRLPERYGVELNDVLDEAEPWAVDHAFEESLLTRNDAAFSQRTWELINQVGGDPLRFDTLIALATDPNRDQNAELVDKELRALSMPRRDAVWSTHLARSAKHCNRLIEWVRDADQDAIHVERANLAGLQLCWFLTTSDRTVRDTATKALVTLLASRPTLAKNLWYRFKNLDDGYVTERLVAAIYGAAMQGSWGAEEILVVVKDLHDELVVNVNFLPNALTRDHMLGLVRYAEMRGLLPKDLRIRTDKSAFFSTWPIEYVTEAEIESYTRTYPTGSTHRDEIASSTVFDGDFARYQIDSAVGDWSAATKGTEHIPTPDELARQWAGKFSETASAAMNEAHEALTREIALTSDAHHMESGHAVVEAMSTFRAAVGEEMYAEWKAEASNWRHEGMFQRLAGRRDGPAQFNLAWARRWVCKRAHDLGWSESLHGDFDLSIRANRHSHSLERIGKKYQWLALYELCARMADNLEPLPGCDASGDLVRLRNIDPSLLVALTEDDGWRHFEAASFWAPSRPELGPSSASEALEWLDANQDIVDDESNIEVVDPADERKWLVLRGFESWRGGSAVVEREVWRRIGCFVIGKKDLRRTLQLLQNHHFQGDGDIPSARDGGLHSHLGEHPWWWRAADRHGEENPDTGWMANWRPHGAQMKAISIRPTTAAYLAEASGYDGSISQNINLNLPSGWLMDNLGLKLSDGRRITYVDAELVIRFMDPSVGTLGRSAALIDRETFLSLLEREGLVAVWALSGEKNVYGVGSRRGFGGRWTFTRLFYSRGVKLVAQDRFQTFDPPDAAQLAALQSAENSPEDSH